MAIHSAERDVATGKVKSIEYLTKYPCSLLEISVMSVLS